MPEPFHKVQSILEIQKQTIEKRKNFASDAQAGISRKGKQVNGNYLPCRSPTLYFRLKKI